MMRYVSSALALLFSVVVSAETRIPLTDLGGGLYQGFAGGLYENGLNIMPSDHFAAGIVAASAVRALDGEGRPSAAGRVVMLSIGMSNTTQEFCSPQNPAPCTAWSFVGQAQADRAVNHTTLVLVNGARGGQPADAWDAVDERNYEAIREQNLRPAGLTEAQVQVAWVKLANRQPAVALPSESADAWRLVDQLGNTVRAMKQHYPNLRIVYFSSRIYAGYATSTLNPEPYAYESAFALKWLVQAQIDQVRAARIVTARAGDLDYGKDAPWIAWGPYLWADGLNARSDGLIWERADLQSDGTHPSPAGQQKVGAMLLNFLKNEPTAKPWFLERPTRRRAVRIQ